MCGLLLVAVLAAVGTAIVNHFSSPHKPNPIWSVTGLDCEGGSNEVGCKLVIHQEQCKATPETEAEVKSAAETEHEVVSEAAVASRIKREKDIKTFACKSVQNAIVRGEVTAADVATIK